MPDERGHLQIMANSVLKRHRLAQRCVVCRTSWPCEIYSDSRLCLMGQQPTHPISQFDAEHAVKAHTSKNFCTGCDEPYPCSKFEQARATLRDLGVTPDITMLFDPGATDVIRRS